MLYYCPLEPYIERYTCQWSAPKVGWLERNWRKLGLSYTRVDGDAALADKPVKAGVVLDAVKRSKFAFFQVAALLDLVEQGSLSDDDVIYFDDFWHPGLEALPYTFHLFGIKPRMYAFLHAQSVDEFDFTWPMRGWMRPVERGFAAALDGIFVCGPCLRDLVVQGGIAPVGKVHITGHPYNSEEVLERMPAVYRGGRSGCSSLPAREDRIVYSSRWDREKNPLFFLDVAKEVIRCRPGAVFVLCTGAKQLRSNKPALVTAAREVAATYPNNFVIREGLSKEEYYAELCRAKIQMNTAAPGQDFVAITLLEASTAGCYPVYPYFRSFPETLRYDLDYMYHPQDVKDAVRLVTGVLDRDDLWTSDRIDSRSWIHSRFDTSWLRMLKVMGLWDGEMTDPYIVGL